MKKIIDGVRYDSEKALLIGEADNLARGVDSVTDLGYWTAALYRTPRSGRFFIVGEGGPQSRFSQSAGQNSWTGGEDLIPMSKREALEWAERYLDPEAIEKHFADLIEDA